MLKILRILLHNTQKDLLIIDALSSKTGIRPPKASNLMIKLILKGYCSGLPNDGSRVESHACLVVMCRDQV